MKFLCCLLLAAAPAAFAAGIGDTYQQVVAEKGPPRSQAAAGSKRVLQYPDVAIVLRDNVVTSINAVITPPAPPPPAPTPPPLAAVTAPTGTREEKIAALEKTMHEAARQVQLIVNQPVTAHPRTHDARTSVYTPGWFHEGATKPDFNRVDVRQTQEFPYDSHEFVSSDLNPETAFVGRELEFNAMTKFFYTDRSLPKKRLTESEMVEINRLYRIIGQCEQQLNQL